MKFITRWGKEINIRVNDSQVAYRDYNQICQDNFRLKGDKDTRTIDGVFYEDFAVGDITIRKEHPNSVSWGKAYILKVKS